jgi:hypothetical protein
MITMAEYGDFMMFYSFIFSSFWTWLGTWFLVCGVASAVFGVIKLVRG